ncbi:helix-turn-helix transcriptional regulator [Photobacterium damselae subsp. piscicida]|nr:AlpA family phage regulatory protein [Photobacterium damselae subsp. piscicida]
MLNAYGVTERLCREPERQQITTLSRSRTWELENQGLFPQRRKLGNTNAWLLSDLLCWIRQRD